MHCADTLKHATKTLQSGGVILFPTDTLWGLGADARNATAVQKILRIKERSVSKGFILILDSYAPLKNIHPSICDDDFFQRAAQEKTPFSFVYPFYPHCCNEVKNADGTVAIRVVKHPLCQALIRSLGFPLVATSANRSGQPFPKDFAGIDPRLLAQVDFVFSPSGEEGESISPTATPSKLYKLSPNKQWIALR